MSVRKNSKSETSISSILQMELHFNRKFGYALYILVYLLTCSLTVYLSFKSFYCVAYFANMCILLPVFGIALMIFRKGAAAFCTFSVLTAFLYYLNEYVYSARHTCIQFSDVYCISDALMVAGKYPPIIDFEIIRHLIIIAALIIIAFLADRKLRSHSLLPGKGFLAAAGAVLFAVPLVILKFMPVKEVYYNINNFTKEFGLPYALYCEVRQSKVQPPDGYSRQSVMDIKERYSSDEMQISASDEPINIIVIMNESFADYSFLGESILSDDPLSEIHALENEASCKSGYAVVSCYGGTTCNTEFEFLTGSCFAFLPNGSIPFIQYMNSGLQSVGKDFNNLGYETIALHPYYSAEWRRAQNYSMLGFDRFIPGEEFSDACDFEFETGSNIFSIAGVNFGDDLEYIRGFVSDAECYRKILSQLKSTNEQGKAAFTFCVTIQNHGGYGDTEDDFIPDQYYDGNNEALNEYLTLSSISSNSFCDFIGELEAYPEKTVVVMFGDHQPGIEAASYLSVSENGLVPEEMSNYVVPYIMWSNYGVEWETEDIMSLNYMSAVIKQNVGLPLTDWDKIRLAAYEKYPALSQLFAVTGSGEFMYIDDVVNDEALSDYANAQYAMMFAG